MSYIRSSSNPEQLYIWGDGKIVTFIKGPYTVGTMPSEILNELLYRYSKHENEDEVLEFEGATIQQVLVDAKDRQVDQIDPKEKILPTDWKIQLSYDGWVLYMWYVTWYYIVETNKEKYLK
jgi:hypothetical protein